MKISELFSNYTKIVMSAINTKYSAGLIITDKDYNKIFCNADDYYSAVKHDIWINEDKTFSYIGKDEKYVNLPNEVYKLIYFLCYDEGYEVSMKCLDMVCDIVEKTDYKVLYFVMFYSVSIPKNDGDKYKLSYCLYNDPTRTHQMANDIPEDFIISMHEKKEQYPGAGRIYLDLEAESLHVLHHDKLIKIEDNLTKMDDLVFGTVWSTQERNYRNCY